MLVIVDYGRGNLYSLSNALSYLGFEHEITNDAKKILKADKIILPGVGAYRDAIQRLNELELIESIKIAAKNGCPILGICLGMQLFASKSFEFGETLGLDFISGNVSKLDLGKNYNIPNIGWRQLISFDNSILYENFNKMMYFVHSYAFYPEDKKNVLAYIKINNIDIPVVVKKDNILGYQFHPEKSGRNGLNLLKYFLEEF